MGNKITFISLFMSALNLSAQESALKPALGDT